MVTMVYPPNNNKSQYCVATNYTQVPFYNTVSRCSPHYKQNFIVASNRNYSVTPRPQTPLSTGSSSSTETLVDVSRNDPTRVKYNDTNPCSEVKSKTELCKNYLDGKFCPFGSRCKFAHGYHEMKQRSLMDLKRQGLVDDIDSYRTRPCFTWISTGSCPFNSRCKCLHDPRARGSTKYWLPHLKMPESSLATDVNVDNMHHLEMEEIHCGSPFGSIIPIKKYQSLDYAWSNLYKTICNIEKDSSVSSTNNIAERHRLEIAIKMHHKKGDLFTYQPSHLLFGELCMVIQTRAFRILDLRGNSDEVIKEIEMDNSGYHQKGRRTVTVREIAFGSAGESSVKKIGLWFDIPDKYLTKCSHKQAKQIQKKINKSKAYEKEGSKVNNESELFNKQKISFFHTFYTSNNDVYDLIKNILMHRASALDLNKNKIDSTSLANNNFNLKAKEIHLKSIFENLMMHYSSWSWPINEGREKLDVQRKDHGVPENDAKYCFSSENKDKFSKTTSHVWDSAISYLEKNGSTYNHGASKLKVFQDLRESKDRANSATRLNETALPYLKQSNGNSISSSNESKQSKCWKSILENKSQKNEWDKVKEFYLLNQ